MDKAMIWGAMPWEQDGGAVVTFYQLQQMSYMDPMFEFHLVPKVFPQADKTCLPLAKWYKVKTRHLGDIPKEIPEIMRKNDIPLLILWHIPWEYFPIVDEVHKIGAKVLNWQTIHWKSDVLFMSDRLRDFDYWVPPTKYARDVLNEVGGIPKSRMTVIPHGVDTVLYYPHISKLWDRWLSADHTMKKKKTITFVGRCQLTKGIVPLMLCARKLVSEFDCNIIFKAGLHDGIWKAREISHLLTKMSGWDKRILFQPQWTTTNYIEELMALGDILICPSGHEGFSLPPLEAMACGKAVALSDIPVHRELIGGKSGDCGLLMPTKDHTEYVNDTQSVTVPDTDMVYGTLKYMLENPDETEAMGKNGLKRVRKYYDLELVCEKWFKVLNKLG